MQYQDQALPDYWLADTYIETLLVLELSSSSLERS
jgi:hypothetical protein